MRSQIVRHAALLFGASALLVTPLRMAAQSPTDGHEEQILVTVLDKSGAVVKNLSAGDFVVREDNQVRHVIAATVATDPMYVAILVDTTRTPQGTYAITQDLRKALSAFVSAVQAASAGTAMSLTECAGAAVTDVSFTTQTDDLRGAIRHLNTLGPQSGAVVLEALLDASGRLGAVRSPRRVIVSVDFDSSAEGSEVLPSKVAEAVYGVGASLWAFSIQPAGVAVAASSVEGVDFAPPSVRETLLSRLPDLTGGEHLRTIGTSSLESNLLRLADILTHQYLVTYIQPDTKPVMSITASSPRGAKTLMAPWRR